MEKHRAILEPKFQVVQEKLESALGGKNIAEWTNPNGGYFVSVDVMDGCAKRVVSLCKEAGVTLTGAGATFPYQKDPRDRNIRVAPRIRRFLSWSWRWICSVSLFSLPRWKNSCRPGIIVYQLISALAADTFSKRIRFFFIAFSMTKPPVLPGVGKKTLAKEKVKNRSFFKGKRMVRRF